MSRLIWKMIKAIVENSGAQRGTLFTMEESTGTLLVSAEYYDEELRSKRRREGSNETPEIDVNSEEGNHSKARKADGKQRERDPQTAMETVQELGGKKELFVKIASPTQLTEKMDGLEMKSSSGLSNSVGTPLDLESNTPISVFSNPQPLEKWDIGPQSVVNLVCRTLQPALLTCAYKDSRFGGDEYIAKVKLFL